jgi:transposase
MPDSILIRRLLLPELHLQRASQKPGTRTLVVHAEKRSAMEVCPRCASPSTSTYDHRTVDLHDAPMRGMNIRLQVRKRRFACRTCRRPFTEPIPGVRKGYRTTERFRRSLLWACENFSDLEAVRRTYRCSDGYVYRALYSQLELERRKNAHPWPKVVGVDEHFFRRERRFRRFVSMVVDYRNSRLIELVDGRTSGELEAALAYIPGRENVEHVVLDLCDPFKNFARNFFPNARLVADKFHVLRLLSPAINRRRREIVGDRRSAELRSLLLRNRRKLRLSQRRFLDDAG